MTDFYKLSKAMKKKLSPVKFYAWMDKQMADYWEIRDNERSNENEGINHVDTLSLDDELIHMFKKKNGLLHENVTIHDVYYEEGAISREEYLNRVNAYCDLDSPISMAIINNKKQVV